ncbi:MAG TPA: LuxR C-terminal-related transcriptional regulator [Myxococcales bacterium]|nr:LuxR C-terminal-related transcriptional regulator [Myxococcales bacterium]
MLGKVHRPLGPCATGAGRCRTNPRDGARQRKVVQLIAEGFSRKEIAARLGLGVKTVGLAATC